jgi:hypothetical protein
MYDITEETHTEVEILNDAEIDAVAGGQDIIFNDVVVGVAALNNVGVGLLASTGTVNFNL